MAEQRNIDFVKEVEKHPCIYNTRLMQYARKDLSEQAWQEIGAKLDMSVSQCKDRWKNLRTTLTRTLKQSSGSSPKRKKPYYLTEAMQFAIPFIRSQNKMPSLNNESGSFENVNEGISHAEYEDERDIQDYVEEIKKEDMMSSDDQSRSPSPSLSFCLSETSLQTNSHQRASSQLYSCPTSSQALQQGIENSRKSTETKEKSEKFDDKLQLKRGKVKHVNDTNLKKLSRKRFLLSLLSDVYSMNDAQMRFFRIRVLNLIDDIVQSSNNSTSM